MKLIHINVLTDPTSSSGGKYWIGVQVDSSTDAKLLTLYGSFSKRPQKTANAGSPSALKSKTKAKVKKGYGFLSQHTLEDGEIWEWLENGELANKLLNGGLTSDAMDGVHQEIESFLVGLIGERKTLDAKLGEPMMAFKEEAEVIEQARQDSYQNDWGAW